MKNLKSDASIWAVSKKRSSFSLKSFLFISIFFGSFSVFAQSPEEQIKKTIATFFEGMYTRDTLLLKNTLHTDCTLKTVVIKNDQPAILKSETMGAFYKSISTIPKNVSLEERLLNHNILVDEALAEDWTPYEFYVNEKLSHKGTNSFTLVKIDNAWKIIAIIDTRKK